MGSILCCPCRCISKIFSPSKNFGTVFCCLPLALFALIASVVMLTWGGFDIWTNVQHANWPDFPTVSSTLLGAVKCLVGVCGLLAVFARWSGGAGCLVFGYKLVIASILVSLVINWISWIIRFINNWKPEPADIRLMISTTVPAIIFLIIGWWALSCFASLQKVLSVNGHGWEGLNYKDLVAAKANKTKNEDMV